MVTGRLAKAAEETCSCRVRARCGPLGCQAEIAASLLVAHREALRSAVRAGVPSTTTQCVGFDWLCMRYPGGMEQHAHLELVWSLEPYPVDEVDVSELGELSSPSITERSPSGTLKVTQCKQRSRRQASAEDRTARGGNLNTNEETCAHHSFLWRLLLLLPLPPHTHYPEPLFSRREILLKRNRHCSSKSKVLRGEKKAQSRCSVTLPRN